MSRIPARRVRLGSLEALHIEGTKDAPTVILFHGYGADMNDLASLAGALQAPKNTNWYFPNGHLKIPLGPHHEGRGWFPISIAALAEGTGVDLSTIVPPGLKRARESALELIEKIGVPMNRLVLGGFSQGAMLATDVVMNLETPPAGLALLSGTLVNVDVWSEKAKRHPGFRFFQAHGKYDQVLSFAMALKLEAVLKTAGWRGQLLPFEGGHEIPSDVLIRLGAFLREVLK